MNQRQATAKAIDEAGGPSVVGRHFDISHTAVIGWVNRGRVPSARVLELEALVASKVTRYQLRPDVFGRA